MPPILNTSAPLVYPAVADLDPLPGPEIVVTDTMASRLYVLRNNGNVLASVAIPNTSANPNCGGPPMIGDVGGFAGPEIGVASCTRYTLFRYDPSLSPPALVAIWSYPIFDGGGQTTSTLYYSPAGPRIVYADQTLIRIFNATNGALMQTIAHSSATAIEGPVIAALDTGPQAPACRVAPGNLIVASNNIWTGSQKGVRIFDDAAIGTVGSCWNQHSFHITNITGFGAIPAFEPPSWTGLPARNTFRVQRRP